MSQNLGNEFQSTYFEIKDQPWAQIFYMVKDHENFLWFSTKYGLYRFDGHEFKLYDHDPNDPYSLPTNEIYLIFEDSLNRLWAHGPTFELVYLDRISNHFVNVDLPQPNYSNVYMGQMLEPSKNHLLILSQNEGLIELKNFGTKDYTTASYFPEVSFSSGFIDEEGITWLGTWQNGLYSLQNLDDINNSLKLEVETDEYIHTVKGYKEKLIIGAWEGFYIYDKKTGQLRNIELPYKQYSPGVLPRGIIQVNNEKFWISIAFGILEFNAETEKITREITTISNNLPEAGYTRLINFGDQKIIAGFRKGIYLFDFNKNVFKNIGVYEQNDESVEWGTVPSVLVDNDDLWYGKHTGGVILRRNGQEYHFDLSEFNDKQAGYPHILEIVKDSVFNRIWFSGHFGIGFLDRKTFDPEHPKFNVFSNLKDGQFNIPTEEAYHIRAFDIDDKGTVWATIDGGLINIISKDGNQFEVNVMNSITKPMNDRPTNYINSIKCDKDLIWCGTNGGLLKLKASLDQRSLVHIEHFYSTNKSQSMSNDYVEDLDLDNSGNLWISTRGGINKYLGNGKFQSWDTTINIKNGIFHSILSAKNNEIWLSTYSDGLFKFDPGNNTFERYGKTEGIKNSAYSRGKFKDEDGNLYFSGDYGITYFNPDDIHSLKPDNKIYLSSIEGNVDVEVKEQVSGSLNNLPALNLRYNQFPLQLHFSSLGYSTNELGNLYYRINPGNDKWTKMAGTDLQLVDLSPGNYNIEINGSNYKGIWNKEPYQIKLEIAPPWWSSILAKFGYAIVTIIIIVFVYRFLLSRKLALTESENLRKLDDLKAKMFSNISHEFRTPLTIVKGLSAQLAKHSTSQNDKDIIKGIEHSNDQLLNLVNQMLDLAALDAKKMEVHYKNGDVIKFIKKSVDLYKSYSDSKLQTINFNCKVEQLIMDFDDDKLQKILNNLVSNAIKFTPEGGRISINVKTEQDKLMIQVSDNGMGIDKSVLNQVFERHYKTNDILGNEGSGIGLALTKDLVELLKGSIDVTSETGKGSIFTVKLPIKNQSVNTSINYHIPFIKGHADEIELDTSSHGDGLKKTILVVEDNQDIQNFIRMLLSPIYNIISAKNGIEGLKVALEKSIDFIISDVMMPKMNGFEFCKQIKDNIDTSHIPFIMISARTESRDKQTAYQLGVDAYLTKPFDSQELKLIIDNLLQKQRERIKYLKELLHLKQGHKNVPDINELDFKLIKNLQRLVLNNRNNFSIDQLAKELYISRAHLHRKLIALTGMSTTQYINYVRMEKAKHLLSESNLMVKEIAYTVGFESATYFSKLFKKELGKTPESFRNALK